MWSVRQVSGGVFHATLTAIRYNSFYVKTWQRKKKGEAKLPIIQWTGLWSLSSNGVARQLNMHNLVSAKSSLTKGMKSRRHNAETCPFYPTHEETYRWGMFYLIGLPYGEKESESRSCWELNDRSMIGRPGTLPLKLVAWTLHTKGNVAGHCPCKMSQEFKSISICASCHGEKKICCCDKVFPWYTRDLTLGHVNVTCPATWRFVCSNFKYYTPLTV